MPSADYVIVPWNPRLVPPWLSKCGAEGHLDDVLVSSPGCCQLTHVWLYLAEEWQQGAPSVQLKSSRLTFEPGPDGLVSRAGLGLATLEPLARPLYQA